MESSAAGQVLSFSGITQGGKLHGVSYGQLKVNAGGIGWKADVTGKSVGLRSDDVYKAEWVPLGSFYQLKITTKDRLIYKFDKFSAKDFTPLKTLLHNAWRIELTPFQYDTTGRNWGEVDLEGRALVFNVNGKPSFELPFTDVSGCVLQSKNEVSMGFHLDDTLASIDSDQLVEVRLYIPSDSDHSAEETHRIILDKADITTTAGGGLATFPNIPVLTPRGRYDIEIFTSFLRLHGKTHDYKISFSSIVHLFDLPKPDGRHICFMISLDPPIRQGFTAHHHLVLQFNKEENLDIELSLKDLEGRLAKDTTLKENMAGRGYKIFRRVVRELTEKKFTRPGSFESFHKAKAVKCSLKANDGYLFPMERSFIFIHKPPTLIRFADISIIEFARVSAGNTGVSNRTFDLVVSTKSGGDVQFTGIQRQEFSNLFNFITAKGIKLKKIANMDNNAAVAAALEEDDDEASARNGSDSEEDADFVGKEDEDDNDDYPVEAIDQDEIAALAGTPKAGKRKRTTAPAESGGKDKGKAASDDDDDDDDDGDFGAKAHVDDEDD